MTTVGRIGLRFFQGLVLCLALVLGAAIMTMAWIMFRYDIKILGVQTGSMQPTIQVGDGLISRPIEFTELSPGEIVTFQTDLGTTVSHRVVSVSSQHRQFVTKGDNNLEPDGPVAASRIISQPIFIVPYAGSVITQLQKPAMLISLVYIPATLLLTREIIRLNSERHRFYRLEI